MQRYWETVERLKINQLYISPTAVRSLLKRGDEHVGKYDRSSLKTFGVVGEPINHEAWEWLYDVVGERKCPVVDTYWWVCRFSPPVKFSGVSIQFFWVSFLNGKMFKMASLWCDLTYCMVPCMCVDCGVNAGRQTETGGVIISPIPADAGDPIYPSMAMRPFFGIDPVIKNSEVNCTVLTVMRCTHRVFSAKRKCSLPSNAHWNVFFRGFFKSFSGFKIFKLVFKYYRNFIFKKF